MGIACANKLSPLRMSLCATAVAFAAVGAAPAVAVAEDGGGRVGVHVTPVNPRPGDEVELSVLGCAGDSGTARSGALTGEVRLAPGTGGTLAGDALVRSTAEPGAHPVEVACDARGGEVTGRLLVTARHGDGHPGHQPSERLGESERPEPPGHTERPGGPSQPGHTERPGGPSQPGHTEHPGGPDQPARPEHPTGPVRAGGGGTAGEAADAHGTAGTAGLTLLSGALAGGALLAVWRLHARER
ncbi:hypothetical protein [Streptomyces litchfieldiae]|uniref:Uncharacterized protein n=1 Tax=Streptomyces litchfieldiae TaxID=3075543 RepID=A0ABU2MMX4_9ACTN|nr:hypothetical protein [Streptomyces sp. DSM 44938]MDT0342965.1 hypothetical protein [Streptomyces sp. DSM 44938]